MIRAAKLHDVLRGDDTVQGRGVLVDRLWPRGVARDDVEWEWLKDVAPSPELRKWFGHDVEKWEEFRRRYRAELDEGAGEALAGEDNLTLLYAAADREHNHALVLAEWLTDKVNNS
ncbi:Uncharacterized conserved protein YeaO, DUF488 family [Corynebacterium pollutisoli]|jgi:uncharacterized protein YeaO (DUF488 family)|uniref:Uncharacterized conserved protein YeaO, DUF488 family n=1 Tax=Corynebacterium pollutisoli TaxID=1610489 RepID=A0A1X7JEC1_9CORY|nr:DUF488 family protein [Corynebacterium pollutisoli]SMG25959.1 Uncharacterized conserved protein YeaO, DUF488 family [Corynebacterium pollutisoli]